MTLIIRQRLFICFVALANLLLAAWLTLHDQPAVPFAVIGVALLPLAWMTGKHPANAAPTAANEGDSYAA